MKRPKIAALAAAAALVLPTAALALAGDAWYGTNRYQEPVHVALAPDERVVIVEDGIEADPVIIERREYIATEPREYVYVEPREYVVTEPRYIVAEPRDVVIVGTAQPRVVCDPLHPEMGHAIGCGLFNKWGPNDFGS